MTEFLQLGFEPAMLTPHKQERAVTTASNLQVRQAVYRSSIGRWKHYQRHLDGVISLLQNEGLLCIWYLGTVYLVSGDSLLKGFSVLRDSMDYGN